MSYHWDFSCPDWVERLEQGLPIVPELPLDQAEATRAIQIFNKLCLPDVPGQPKMREAAGDWFRDIVGAAFGSLDQETNIRHVGEIFALVPKKNSKTTGGAGIAVTALLMNARPRAEMMFVGPTQEIADLAFQQAVGMIEADEVLRPQFKIQEHKKQITHIRSKAFLKIKTFDMKVMTGSKPVIVILDELHIMSKMSSAMGVLGQIRGGMAANDDSLLIIITTQSEDPPAGVFKQELQYARGVRDGSIADEVIMLPVLYEFPESMQIDDDKPWMNPECWPMVTPNLGLSLKMDTLVRGFAGAKERGDEELARWASQHLNIEIGMALHSDRWIGVDYWKAATDRKMSLEAILASSDVVTIGIDGGGLDDLLGLSIIGRHRATRVWQSWSHAWAHKVVLKKRKEIAPRLKDFKKDGDLTICKRKNSTQDIVEVVDIIERIYDLDLLPEAHGIGLDPYGVAPLVDEMAERGIPDEVWIGIGQGTRLSPAIWGMERKLNDLTFSHCDSKMMDWCMGNARAEQRGNAILITKQVSGKAKIDPLVAMFNAAMLMQRNPEAASSTSIYQKRGLLAV